MSYMYYLDYDMELHIREEMNWMTMYKNEMCPMTIDEKFAQCGITLMNGLRDHVYQCVNKDVQFKQVYATEIANMSMFSMDDHMAYMQMWEEFEPQMQFPDDQVNTAMQVTCEAEMDMMLAMKEGEIQAINAWFVQTRQGMEQVAAMINAYAAMQQQVNDFQLSEFNRVKNLAETSWKCDFDAMLENDMGWPAGSIQDYQNCGADWVRPAMPEMIN